MEKFATGFKLIFLMVVKIETATTH